MDDFEYPPGDWSVEEIAATLRDAPAAFPLPTYDDERAWSRYREDETTAPLVEAALDEAAAVRGEPVPRLPPSLYLDYEREGVRTTYQDPENERRRRLSVLALAECIERDGRYLDDVLDYAWAVTEQATWVLPAHLEQSDAAHLDGLPRPVPPADRHVALRPAGTAATLAELDYVLGDRLHPALRERVRETVERRVLIPYEEGEFFWQTVEMNWNAVCNAGVGVAALHLLDDPDRQARIVAEGARSLRHYLAGFGRDGCTPEGIGYWNYGFGNYVRFAAHLEARTDGALSLFSPPVVERIAGYPLAVELSPGRYVPFSDTDERARPAPHVACYLGERFDEPGLLARGREALTADPSVGSLSAALRNLAWVAGTPDVAAPSPPRNAHLRDCEWVVSRVDPDDPDALAVAVKAGHNAEPHNHNDVGSVVVHRRRESLLTDLGSPTYDADYFGPDRYGYLAARSLGHSVPLVDGHEQAAGREYAGAVLAVDAGEGRDAVELDLAGAYPDAAGLDALVRRVVVERRRPAVRVADDPTFADGDPDRDRDFASVFVADAPVAATDDGFTVDGKRGQATVTADGDVSVRVDHIPDAMDAAGHTTDETATRDVWRARLSPADSEAGVAVDVTFD